MKIFETQEEADKAKQQFYEQVGLSLEEGDIKNYTSQDINWDINCNDWNDAKYKAKNLITQSTEEYKRLIFLGSTKEVIEGKPQLVHQTLQRIACVRKVTRNDGTKAKPEFVTEIKFLDEKYDKRYDGKENLVLAFDFWVYRVISDGKEYFLFSREKLSEEYSEIRGMKVDLDDMSDMSNTLKMKKITSVFFVFESSPKISVLEPQELVEHIKEKEWTQENFKDYFFSHPDGRIFEYTEDFNLLRIAQMLSSKYEGYPLHLLKMGPVGTGKTTEAEVLDAKFQEEQGILEAANSTLKALVPSFKEKPANLGYICNCNRVAIIDELMKMVEQAMSKSHDFQRVSNYFGQMNMLLEHKKRTVGSGNDNSAVVHSTAKICVTTNNVTNKNTIAQHLGLIDATTLSRYLPWVQDKEEVEKIYNNEGIRTYRTHIDNPPKAFSRESHTPHQYPLRSVSAKNDHKSSHNPQIQEISDSFLTIYDSCQQFLVNFDHERCKKIFETIKDLAKEPMRQVWRARGLHHTILVLDGITKFRCLFKDYDSSFEPKDEDYERLEQLLRHMVKGWDTPMVPVNFEEGF